MKKLLIATLMLISTSTFAMDLIRLNPNNSEKIRLELELLNMADDTQSIITIHTEDGMFRKVSRVNSVSYSIDLGDVDKLDRRAVSWSVTLSSLFRSKTADVQLKVFQGEELIKTITKDSFTPDPQFSYSRLLGDSMFFLQNEN